MASPPPSSLSKKLKMSTTSSDTEQDPTTATATADDRKPRYKRRKVAIFIAYCGFGYQGMQKNPGARTIESDLEQALFLSGAVPESDKNSPKRFDWARSARTDKGVSAAGQVVSGRFYVDPPGFVERLNSNLYDQIRVFGFKRVTNSFSAKKFCDRRRYVYLLPVFALDPNSHPNRDSVAASVGSVNELVKCVECSERGRKVVGVMGRQSRVLKEQERSEFDAENGEKVEVQEEKGEFEIRNDEQIEIGDGEFRNGESSVVKEGERIELEVGNGEDGQKIEVGNGELKNEESTALLEEERSDQGARAEEKGKIDTNNVGSKFEYGEKEKGRFNGILKRYVGTHNFHNFTTRTKSEDPAAHRFIISFKADRVVSLEGIEFVRCEIVGQSFMLHQIRKMIGLAVAVMRNCCPESLMDIALRK